MMNNKKSAGFSLLEILITVFILSVGLLGLASMQTVSLKNNHSAQYRTMATVFAYDMLERIRLNKGDDYSLSLGSTPSGADLKNQDLIEWVAEIKSQLPSGAGWIEDNGHIVNINIQWDDSRASGSKTQTFSVTSERSVP